MATKNSNRLLCAIALFTSCTWVDGVAVDPQNEARVTFSLYDSTTRTNQLSKSLATLLGVSSEDLSVGQRVRRSTEETTIEFTFFSAKHAQELHRIAREQPSALAQLGISSVTPANSVEPATTAVFTQCPLGQYLANSKCNTCTPSSATSTTNCPLGIACTGPNDAWCVTAQQNVYHKTFAKQIAQQQNYQSCWPTLAKNFKNFYNFWPGSNAGLNNTWGPWPVCYSVDSASIPASDLGKRQQIQIIIDYLYSLKNASPKRLTYAHHHDPYWSGPIGYNVGFDKTPNANWHGIDCTDTTAFVYNMVFGVHMNSKTNSQSSQAIKRYPMNQLQFGDLMYFTAPTISAALRNTNNATLSMHGGFAYKFPIGNATTTTSTSLFSSTYEGNMTNPGPNINSNMNTWPLANFQFGFKMQDVLAAWNNQTTRSKVFTGVCFEYVSGVCDYELRGEW